MRSAYIVLLTLLVCSYPGGSRNHCRADEPKPEPKLSSSEIDIYANPNTFQKIREMKIGDTAPMLNIDKWYNSSAIETFEEGTVYVVEFWASWCGPCRKSIPHLNQLQQEFGDDLVVIGVAASERGGPEKLEQLLATKLNELSYPIAYTQNPQPFNDYMRAANNTGLPWAFIVDRAGKIAWWGQPFYSLFESTLRSVMSGTFVPQTGEKPVYAKKEAMGILWDTQDSFWGAYGDEDWDRAVELGKTLLAANNELFYYESASLFDLLYSRQNKRTEAMQLATELENGLLMSKPEGLYVIANAILDATNPSEDDIRYGVHVARKAVALTFNENPTTNILFSKLLYKSGDTEGALSTLRGLQNKIDDEDLKEEYNQLMKTFQSAH